MQDDSVTGGEGDAVELPELHPKGQLRALLDAPDRDRCPGARPVVSVHDGDDPAFIAEVNARCVSAPRLERRGVHHGDWAELHDQHAFFPKDPLPALAERWEAARPIVLHDVLDDDLLDGVESDRWLEPLRSDAGSDTHIPSDHWDTFVTDTYIRVTGIHQRLSSPGRTGALR